jgi:hypothetical protein
VLLDSLIGDLRREIGPKNYEAFARLTGELFSTPEAQLLWRYVTDKRAWLDGATPWYTEGAKSWLASNVLKTDSALEFGGGRSTIWWCGQVHRASLVEASPEWTIWILLHLFSRPELLKNLRLHFVPAEWNPSFQGNKKRYWSQNRAALAETDVLRMEADLTALSGLADRHNILVLDGAIRGYVLARFGIEKRFGDFDMIVIDNTESDQNAFVADYYLADKGYERLDFVAGPLDVVPAHQNGKHITSIYVSKARIATETPIHLGRPYRLTDEQRRAHQHEHQATPAQLVAKIESNERYVREFLKSYG